jgi:hypothetical protein
MVAIDLPRCIVSPKLFFKSFNEIEKVLIGQ